MHLNYSDVNFTHSFPTARCDVVVFSHEFEKDFADLVVGSFHLGHEFKDSFRLLPVTLLIVLEPFVEGIVERLQM